MNTSRHHVHHLHHVHHHQMRILFLNWNAYTDNGSGASRSMRTMLEWLADAGHECRAITAGVYEGTAGETLENQLPHAEWTRSKPANPKTGAPAIRATASSDIKGVRVVCISTKTPIGSKPLPADSAAFVQLATRTIEEFRPDIVLTANAHRAIHECLRRAKLSGAHTVLSCRNYGFEKRFLFEHADSVLVPSKHLATHYLEAVGIDATVIPSPISWAEVRAREGPKDKLIFVNPSLRKGAHLVARVAQMLSDDRPDIPLMFVVSMVGAEYMRSLIDIDWETPQFHFLPATDQPKDFFAHAKVLLAPSLQEAFGRVAVEACINGIPALISDVGGLAESGEGFAQRLPLPASLRSEPNSSPSKDEAGPWFDAICRYWDDAAYYKESCSTARSIADSSWREENQRAKYLDFFRFGGMAAGTMQPAPSE